jgi:hypothetical protein
MPFDVSDERNLLASMIAERDAQISSLTHQLHSTTDALRDVQREVSSKSSARRQQREEHSSTIKRLKDEHSESRRVLARFESNVKSGGGLRVHEYAALMRSANSTRVESSYVLRLQAQLCRAMHGLGVMESQLALVKENCSGLIKFMKEDLSHMVDDRTCREIELMNGLAKVDNEKRVMASEMERKIREREELLDQVREEYEELGLEYDEDEVKTALEVRYLLEQMEKVREDRVRLEKELLVALLEREEQIQRLKVETDMLDERFNELSMEEEGKRRGGDANLLCSSNYGESGEKEGGIVVMAASEEEHVDGGDGIISGDRTTASSSESNGDDGEVAGDADDDDQVDERGGVEKEEDAVATTGQQENVVVSEEVASSPLENAMMVVDDAEEMPTYDDDDAAADAAAAKATPGADEEYALNDDEPIIDERAGRNDGPINESGGGGNFDDGQEAGDADDQVVERGGGGEEEEGLAKSQEGIVVSETASPWGNKSTLVGEDGKPVSDAAAAAAAESTPADGADSDDDDEQTTGSEHVESLSISTMKEGEEPLERHDSDVPSSGQMEIPSAAVDR